MNRFPLPILALALILVWGAASPARAAEEHAPALATSGPILTWPATPVIAWVMPDLRVVLGNRTRMIQFATLGMCLALWILLRNK